MKRCGVDCKLQVWPCAVIYWVCRSLERVQIWEVWTSCYLCPQLTPREESVLKANAQVLLHKEPRPKTN